MDLNFEEIRRKRTDPRIQIRNGFWHFVGRIVYRCILLLGMFGVRFTLHTKREWQVLELKDPDRVHYLSKGDHEVYLAKVPLVDEEGKTYFVPWLVVFGLDLGASVGSWTQWYGAFWNDFEVTITLAPRPYQKYLDD